MSPRLLIMTVCANGLECPWLVDEWKDAGAGERDLIRSGEVIITLGPDDYANGWDEFPWPGIQEPSGDEIDMEVDEDGEVILSFILPTVH